jgi:hypothetical protein
LEYFFGAFASARLASIFSKNFLRFPFPPFGRKGLQRYNHFLILQTFLKKIFKKDFHRNRDANIIQKSPVCKCFQLFSKERILNEGAKVKTFSIPQYTNQRKNRE